MNEPMFDEIALASRHELACEIINRTRSPALIVLAEDGVPRLSYYQTFDLSGRADIAKLLRDLADVFENGEVVPVDGEV